MIAPELKEEFAGKNVLITGGLGFIGSNLARALADADAQVILVDSLVPEYGGNLHNVDGLEEVVRINVSDVRDEYSFRNLLQGQDVLFNLAGQTSHLDSMIDPYHGPRDQLPEPALDPRGLPTRQPVGAGRFCEHTADLRSTEGLAR